MMKMSYTVTCKGTVTIPANIRRKYRIKEGTKIEFIDTEQGILLIPVPPLDQLFGIDTEHSDLILQTVRNLRKERQEEINHEETEL